MSWWHALQLHAKALLNRRRLERDLQDELAFHLAMRQEQLRAEGMSGPEARGASHRAFGNETVLRETLREQWTLVWLDTLMRDLRYACRMLRRSPGVTAVIVISLALGIGANSAIFSLVNAALLRTLPIDEPDRLMLCTWSAQAWPERVMDDLEGSLRTDELTGQSWSWSFSTDVFEYLRSHNHVFENTVAFAANSDTANIGLDGRAEVARVQAVSGDFFQGLRVTPIAGRAFVPDDDREGAPLVVMVSSAFWKSRMNGDSGAIGRSLVINGRPATVVGVLPPSFFGVEPGANPEIWMTLGHYAQELARSGDFDLRAPGVWWLGVLGRLREGVNEAQARAEVKVLFDQVLGIGTPDVPRDSKVPDVDVMSASRGLDVLRDRFSTSLYLLMGMVGLVLVIACANVGGLLLARATARRREIALRMSLGAPRSRVVRQLITESLLYGVLGGVAGLALAYWSGSGLVALVAGGRTPVSLPLHLDTTVLAFTAVVSVVCGLAFGTVPAMLATRLDSYPVLKQGSGTETQARKRSGRVLVAGQVAISLLLIVSAGLLLRTLDRLQQTELGFDHKHLLTFRVQPGLNGYKAEHLSGYFEELQRRIQGVPGVRAISFSQLGPVGSGSSSGRMGLPGYTEPGKRVDIHRHWIGPGYFTTLGIPVILGRALDARDDETGPRVAVVNQRAVREYFRGDNPIGHTVETGSEAQADSWTIVGVVGDAKYNSLREDPPPTVYLSYRQRPGSSNSFMTYVVQAGGDPGALTGAIRQAALSLDKDVPVLEVRTGPDVIDRVLAMERLFAILSSAFGLVALVLACVGLYGTMAYAVTRRRREIGVRLALGAAAGTIVTMVLRETLQIVLAGAAVGLPLVWVSTRFLESRLFGLSPHDPLTLSLSLVVIVGVMLAAGFLPAYRAGRVDPATVLRCE